ncbi:MAG: zeta toxin family protein [Staphylococcus equorum]|nr:zeta toxin family protein [Chryseobacterium sp.]MDN5637025.1 zeta toxin family protein [Staphylococcus equorum]
MNYNQLINKYFDVSKEQAISQEHPIAIITIGAENSGKEVITAQAQDELSHRGGSILIDKDLIAVADPQQTEQEKDKTIKSLLDSASNEKYNLVINQNFKNEQDFEEVSKGLKNKGYEIDVRTISSPQELNNKRQEEHDLLNIKSLEKSASLILKEDDTPKLLNHIEKEDLADKVKVYDRVGNEVYSNEKNPDGETWLKQKEAYNVYNFETNKPLARSESEYILLAQHQLKELKDSHAIINSQFNDLSENKVIENKKLELTLDKPKYIRQAKNFKDVQRGIVVENNEDKLILKLNDTVGIEYDKKQLQQDQKDYSTLRLGQELHINHSGNSPQMMNEQEIMDYHITQNDQSHDIGLDHSR